MNLVAGEDVDKENGLEDTGEWGWEGKAGAK